MIEEYAKLVKKEFGIQIDASNFKRIVLFPFKAKTHFEETLITMRVEPCMIMSILHNLCMDKKFGAGVNHRDYYSQQECYDEEKGEEYKIDTTEASIGPSILKQKFKGKDIFNTILRESWISVIDIPTYINLNSYTPDKWTYEKVYDNEHGVPNEKIGLELFLKLGNEFYISLDGDIIITQKAIYVNSKDKEMLLKSEAIIKHFREIFKSFLDEFRNAPFVTHRYYIDNFIKWYPGNVRIKTLE